MYDPGHSSLSFSKKRKHLVQLHKDHVARMLTMWLALFLAILSFAGATSNYNVGIGIADNTGPAAEIGMVS